MGKRSVKESGMKLHGNLKDRESWRFRTRKSMTVKIDLCLMNHARVLYVGAVAPKRCKQKSCSGEAYTKSNAWSLRNSPPEEAIPLQHTTGFVDKAREVE